MGKPTITNEQKQSDILCLELQMSKTNKAHA